MESELQDHLQQAIGDTYAIERELRGGAMSRVFVAVERSLGRRVVIKVLPPEFLSGVSEARFQREVLLTANLQHPHILPVLAAGARDELCYYVTPYVDGQSLRQRLVLGGLLPVTDAVNILRELAGALAHAHARGVIHRDVKPENILLSGGHAVVADFGIARAVEQATRAESLTGTGLGLGTPGYMAPEQLAGDPTVDARADVFALGVVGYEMLAGQPPFTGATPSALATAYFTAPPKPLHLVRPEVPPAVARAITRALARAPEERFATAAEFCDALLASDGDSRRPLHGRRRLRLALAGLLVAGLVGIAALGLGVLPRMEPSEPSGRKTLAVLPFKNVGPAEHAYFADGITEEVTSRLASLSGLGVISRTSADQYRNSTKPLRQIARELGAEYVLEGSVRWEPTADGRGRVRVTPQLIRVQDDSHLWAERYDAELSGVFEVQSQIAEAVAGELAVALGAGERHRMEARPTENLAAYDAYMRGERLRVLESMSPTSLARATALLSEATAADPRFALAFAKLSLAHQTTYDHWFDRSAKRLTQARAAADSALALDPALPEGHLALGRLLESRGELDRAAAEYTLAERGRPNDSRILVRTATMLERRGQWAEALARFRRAAELDPRAVDVNLSAAEALGLTRDYAAAMAYVERALAADSTAMEPYLLQARLELARGARAKARETARQILLRFGAERAATSYYFQALVPTLDSAELRTLERVSPSAFAGNRIVYLHWRVALFHHWNPERARAHADSLLKAGAKLIRAQRDDQDLHAGLGWLLAVLGRRDEAVREVRQSLSLVPRSRDALSWAEAAEIAAETYVQVGDYTAAIRQLEELLKAPSWVSAPLLRTDPFWEPLHGHPRFDRLISRVS